MKSEIQKQKQIFHQPHQTLLIISLSIFVVTALAYGFMKKTLDISIDNVANMRSQIRSADMIVTEGRFLNTLAADTATNRAKVRSHVLLRDKAVDLIVAIESFGQKSGSRVTIVSIDSPKSSQASSTTGVINMNINAIGPWSSIMNVLSLVEGLPYITSIDSIRMNILEKENWNLDFKLHALTI
ncbi:MAG: hypothetical protein WCO48_03480 [Candidatus Taylorbacteria bacterium]